jgi:hypothetical protein
MDFQDWKDQRKADLASALLANTKLASRRTAPTAAPTTAKGVAASLGFDYDDEGPIETVPNPNANGRKWLKVTATNIVPSHLAGGE